MSIKKLKTLKVSAPSNVSYAGATTIEKIDDYLKASYNKPGSTIFSHKPSMVGASCFRKIYYSYFRTEVDVPVDARGAKIFETGKFLEDMIMSWLKAIGEFVPYRDSNGKEGQYPISIPEWGIERGYLDNVAILDGKTWIYEIKTMNTKKFQDLEAPVPDHIIQAALYFIAFLKYPLAHLPKELGGVKYIYIDKNTSMLKEFSLTSEELLGIIPKVEARLDKANAFVAKKELPPKTEGDCFFCPWRNKCKKDFNPVKL